jgi:hypothetical protein
MGAASKALRQHTDDKTADEQRYEEINIKHERRPATSSTRRAQDYSPVSRVLHFLKTLGD